MDKKENYHFRDLRAELVSVGEMVETHPGHFEVRGTIRLPGQYSDSDSSLLPIVAYNKMASAMVEKMRLGQTYGFNGYFIGSASDKQPRMVLQVCWTDRLERKTPNYMFN